MAKKGIKVKDIAHELGITSRQLIDRCRAKGIHVQNSITKLNPESERTVRSWFVGGQPTDAAQQELRPPIC